MKRRNFLGLSSALGLSAFAPNLFAKEDFVIYGAPAVPSIIIAVAALQGNLSKTKNTKLQIWKNPDQLRAGVASGDFKVMMSPSNVAVNLRNQGQNLAILNILTGGINGLMSKNQNIKELKDLIGKKLIMPFKNDMPDLVLKALCKAEGVDVSKINITYTATPPEAMSLFLAKDYELAILPEPMATVALIKAKSMNKEVFRSLKFHKIWGKTFKTAPLIPQAGMIVNLDFYEKNIKDFEIFHKDLENALTWIYENKKEAGVIGANYLPAKAPIMSNAFEHSNLIVKKAKDMKDDLMKFYEILLEMNPKILGGKLPEASFFL